jgi:uncharacterized membrane protein YjjP (DUF1212 family)
MDLWWLAVGAIGLYVGAALAALQEVQESPTGSLRGVAAWKHRFTLYAAGFVAIGASGSLIQNQGTPWLPFVAAFFAVPVVLLVVVILVTGILKATTKFITVGVFRAALAATLVIRIPQPEQRPRNTSPTSIHKSVS